MIAMRLAGKSVMICVLIVATAVVAWQLERQRLSARDDSPNAQEPIGTPDSDNPARNSIKIDYPADGSIFPPEIIPPTFYWHDAIKDAALWQIDVLFADGAAGVHAESEGQLAHVGEIDQRCIMETNQLPTLTPEQATAHTWTPDAETWEAIKNHSVAGPAIVTIVGRKKESGEPVSRGQVVLRTSSDPVGAPIFYRDVPLAPDKQVAGVIKPIVERFLPLIGWRLRNIAEPKSRLLLEGMTTCANCHSFSGDGRTLGMDLDGPSSDKGLYVLSSIAPQMSIRNKDVIRWNSAPPKTIQRKALGAVRVGFMSQVSPDGQYVVTTLNPEIYSAVFSDYRFLQAFYPTRGTLVWYNRATGRKLPLPGADDPRYVHTDVVWSPDGKYLVFARAEAKVAHPDGAKWAEYANDPNETPIQYDLYRMPFSDGQGGSAQPIAGASQNGMSNTFPKVSPDGRWIVFVKCHNGQLMRPDGELYIVPAEGGQARRLQCNAPPMNSWHSFSPNSRWLVFSSKRWSPYTQMFLTHLDEEGNDSPAILIDNATAANRAVNIPEFVNIPPDDLLKIDVPAAEQFNLLDRGRTLAKEGDYKSAAAAFQEAIDIDPDYVDARYNLGLALAKRGQFAEALRHYQHALKILPDDTEAMNNLAWLRATCPDASLRDGAEAVKLALLARELTRDPNANILDTLAAAYAEAGRFPEAVQTARMALDLATRQDDQSLTEAIRAEILLYEAGTPCRAMPQAAVAGSIQP